LAPTSPQDSSEAPRPEAGWSRWAGQDLLRPWAHVRGPSPLGNVGASRARKMAAHLWRLCRHACYRLPHSRPGRGWSMRGVVVPPPARPADLRAWYSGDRFPNINFLCRSQLWCPRRGVPALGAHPSGQVGAACSARHDIPHRTHHQRVWPGWSGRRVKCPRLPGANSAASGGKTIRRGTPAACGPGLGSMSPHVAREPGPVGNGGSRGGDRVRLWWECVGTEYRACHADLILRGGQVAK